MIIHGGWAVYCVLYSIIYNTCIIHGVLPYRDMAVPIPRIIGEDAYQSRIKLSGGVGRAEGAGGATVLKCFLPESEPLVAGLEVVLTNSGRGYF